MRTVTPAPVIATGDWVRLLNTLREHATSINQAAGGILGQQVSVTGTYTAGVGDLIILCAPTGAFTLTLPSAISTKGVRFFIKRTNNTTHTITISPASGNIDPGGGSAPTTSATLTTAYQGKEFYSDGATYWQV